MGASGDEANKLTEMLRRLQGATSIDKLRLIIIEAKAALTSAGLGEQNGPEAAWDQVKNLIHKADDAVDALGNYITDKQKKHIEELKAKLEAAEKDGDEKAKADAAKELAAYYQQIGKEAEAKAIAAGDVNAQRKAQELQEIGKQVDSKTSEFLESQQTARAVDSKKSQVSNEASFKESLSTISSTLPEESDADKKSSLEAAAKILSASKARTDKLAEESTAKVIAIEKNSHINGDDNAQRKAQELQEIGKQVDSKTSEFLESQQTARAIDSKKSQVSNVDTVDEDSNGKITTTIKNSNVEKITKTDLKPETASMSKLGDFDLPLPTKSKQHSKLQQIS